MIQFFKQKIWLIVIVAFSLRLLMGIVAYNSGDGYKALMRPDSNSYIEPAKSLAKNGKFNVSIETDMPETNRPIGYPLFLAFFLKIHTSFAIPIIFSCILSSLICFIIYRSALLFNKKNAGLIAAILYAFNLTSFVNAPLLCSDTLFAFLAAVQFYFFIRFYIQKKISNLWISIFFNSIATLVRPTGLFWIVPCVFLCLIFKHKTYRDRFFGAIVCIIIFLSVIFPWMVRNNSVGAGYTLSSINSAGLYYFVTASLVSIVTNESATTLREKWRQKAKKEFDSNTEKYKTIKAKTNYEIKEAKRYIFKYPWLFIKLYIQPLNLVPDIPTFFEFLGFTKTGRGTLDILTRKGIMSAIKHYFGEKTWLLFTIIPLLFVVFISYFVCVFQLIKWIKQKQFFLLWTFLAFVVYYPFLTGPIIMPRYHLPSLPMIVLMAGCMIENMIKRHRKNVASELTEFSKKI